MSKNQRRNHNTNNKRCQAWVWMLNWSGEGMKWKGKSKSYESGCVNDSIEQSNNWTIENAHTHTHIYIFIWFIVCCSNFPLFKHTHAQQPHCTPKQRETLYINKKIANNNTTATVRNKKSATAITTMLTYNKTITIHQINNKSASMALKQTAWIIAAHVWMRGCKRCQKFQLPLAWLVACQANI